MSSGHARSLHHAVDSPVHRLPAHGKLLALLGFVLIVVATPRTAFWAFGAYAALLAFAVALARLPPLLVLRRMAIEVPFVVFALVLPFLAAGERVDVGGVSLSAHGLLAAWNILAKGTLGVAASVVLAATTSARDLLVGVQRLGAPELLTQIALFMVRYGDVVTAEAARMRTARAARGFDARNLRHSAVLAHAAGALFIRAYERGERVYVAMLSRGYTGQLPAIGAQPVRAGQWLAVAALPAAALAVAVTAWLF
jgi:cobalt/nickel transport system permease protein